MLYLVDTSVWIDVFRKDASYKLTDLIDFDEVVTCWPVIQEVLQGFRGKSAFAHAKAAMLELPITQQSLSSREYESAIHLYRSARKAGKTIRSSIDCLIAACAMGAGCAVLHKDRDFDSLKEVSELNVKRVT